MLEVFLFFLANYSIGYIVRRLIILYKNIKTTETETQDLILSAASVAAVWNLCYLQFFAIEISVWIKELAKGGDGIFGVKLGLAIISAIIIWIAGVYYAGGTKHLRAVRQAQALQASLHRYTDSDSDSDSDHTDNCEATTVTVIGPMSRRDIMRFIGIIAGSGYDGYVIPDVDIDRPKRMCDNRRRYLQYRRGA